MDFMSQLPSYNEMHPFPPGLLGLCIRKTEGGAGSALRHTSPAGDPTRAPLLTPSTPPTAHLQFQDPEFQQLVLVFCILDLVF